MTEKQSTTLWIQMLGLAILLSAALWLGYVCGSPVQARSNSDECEFTISSVSYSQQPEFFCYTIEGVLENKSDEELVFCFDKADGGQFWSKNVPAHRNEPFSIEWNEDVNGYPIGAVLRVTTEDGRVLLYEKNVVLYPMNK